MKNLVKTTVAIAMMTMMTGTFAYTTGAVSTANQSGDKKVIIGNSNGKVSGKAGIKIWYYQVEHNPNANSVNQKTQAFEKIASMSKKGFAKSIIQKSGNVYIAKMYNMNPALEAFKFIPEHRDAGRMSFEQVGNMDVWFGDWEDVPRNSKIPDVEATKYTVYYAGVGKTTSKELPKSGKAVYKVEGINQHRHVSDQTLKGQLTADFSNKTLKGDMKNELFALNVDAKINSDASFKGNAIATGSLADGVAKGESKGQFYGNKAAGLAGIATFKDKSYLDTAFGGVKK